MVQELLHQRICQSCDNVRLWFAERSKGLELPIYGSFDIRDSGDKVVPVDANLFPAGFNNICDVDQESGVETLKNYITSKYRNINRIGLVTEEHTNNAYYWNNVSALKKLFEGAGFKLTVLFPGEKREISPIENTYGELFVPEFLSDYVEESGEQAPFDLLVSNNDFSTDFSEWAQNLKTTMDPPYKMGWHKRRKGHFFRHYNQLVVEFSRIIDVNPEYLSVKTIEMENFDLSSESAVQALAQKVDELIQELKNKGQREPKVFVKNSSGTYGLGVTSVSSGQDILNWNYKTRKKMKAAKGGGKFQSVIVQEGVSSRVVDNDGLMAEPVIYMIGCTLLGGFLRTHKKAGPLDSLNAPGAVYKKLCVSDLQFKQQDCPMENVYGWVSKIAMLALALEVSEAV